MRSSDREKMIETNEFDEFESTYQLYIRIFDQKMKFAFYKW